MKLAVVILIALCASASAQPVPAAETLYAEGQAAYDRGDFATAVARWQASYKASGEPGLLFILGQALRQNGQCKEALFTYRRFLALDATDEHRPLAEEFIRELGPCDAPTPSPKPAQPPSAPVDTPHVERIAGIATGGAGAVLLVTGIAFGVHASSLGGEAKACTPTTPCNGTTYAAIDSSGHHDATVGRVLDVFGIAALAGGAALYYLGSRAPEVMVAPVVAPHDAGAVLTWRHAW